MWPFKKKPAPLNPGPINEDWKAGDLAECVCERWRDDGGRLGEITKGDVLGVTSVQPDRTDRQGDGWYLCLRGVRGQYRATGFRKLPPLNSEADAEFIAQIKSLKPKVTPHVLQGRP